MVDSIGAKTVAGDPRVAAVARARPVAPIEGGTPGDAAPTGAAPSNAGPSTAAIAQTLSAAMASTAPVDSSRVAQIKTALANGTFPILPATIADRLIAYRYDWIANDKA